MLLVNPILQFKLKIEISRENKTIEGGSTSWNCVGIYFLLEENSLLFQVCLTCETKWGGGKCVCVCVCEWERERERVSKNKAWVDSSPLVKQILCYAQVPLHFFSSMLPNKKKFIQFLKTQFKGISPSAIELPRSDTFLHFNGTTELKRSKMCFCQILGSS